MKRNLLTLLGCLIIATTILSSCSTQANCAAYNTYPKKSKRTK